MLRQGREREAAQALRRAAAGAAAPAERAVLERWAGLLLVRCGREVEGTFAIERADAKLDLLGLPQPTLEGLLQHLGLEGHDPPEP